MRRLILVIFLLALLVPAPILAANIILSNPSTDTFSDPNAELEVDTSLSIDTADGTIYYLRGVFFKENTFNYCGYTWNGSDWFSGPYSSNDGWKNFLKVTISSNSAQSKLKAKLDTNDSGCKESGTYKFKIQRFTENSSSGTFDSQNEHSLSVTIPSATPTPQPTNTPVPSAKPSNTPVPPTIKVTLKPSITLIKKANIPSSLKVVSTGSVLGEKTTVSPAYLPKNSTSQFPLATILIGLGGTLILGAGIYTAVIIKKQKRS